jgi:hypothetical protein
MQCALVAMLAAGYRPAANQPGHHQTLIQSLPLTLFQKLWNGCNAVRNGRTDHGGQMVT